MTTEGAFLLDEDPRLFDHSFFGIGAVEVETMDPSQRKLLEVVYEAFENAGETWHSVSGSKTGVYVGNFTSDHLIVQSRDIDDSSQHAGIGTGNSILSNRINYIFNLRGPSLTIDTACSSGMYALHLAVMAIRNGDCEAAIVAGSNTIMDPSTHLTMVKLGVLSPTSACHTFDESADGYARGEGFAAIYLKRLSDAVANGNPVRALIRSTAVNANGRTGGITHPSREGQEAVMREAYARAGLPFDATTFFECHGTGTPVGDPVEVSAIANVFGPFMTAERPLLIGSVKPNIGHTEPSSALAGIMKVVLAMEHGRIPATIGLKKLNSRIDTRGGRIKIVTENIDWPEGRGSRNASGELDNGGSGRYASVNSFGYGGANGHCIIEGYDADRQGAVQNGGFVVPALSDKGSPALARSDETISVTDENRENLKSGASTESSISSVSSDYERGSESALTVPSLSKEQPNPIPIYSNQADHRKWVLLPFMAHNETSLNLNIVATVASLTPNSIPDVAYTLSNRRSIFKYRNFLIADRETPQAIHDRGAVSEVSSINKPCRVLFIFTGQGAQWHGMGRRLMQYQVFRRTIRYLDSVLQRLEPPPAGKMEDVLLGDCDTLLVHEPEVSQTVCTALQVGMVDLFQAWNICPAVAVGHSSGEIAAAYACGRISAVEALAIAYYRGMSVSQNDKKGAMLAVGLSRNDAQNLVTSYRDQVTIAAVNSPMNVTLSGDEAAILKIASTLSERKVFNRLLKTCGNAYHSHHMKGGVASSYEALLLNGLALIQALGLDETNGQSSERTGLWVSSVFPEDRDGPDLTPNAGYWRTNLESTVRFSDALRKAVNISDIDIDALVEIGPHTALQGPVREILGGIEKEIPYVGTLKRNEDGDKCILASAGRLFCLGYDVRLLAVNSLHNPPVEPGQPASRLQMFHGRVTPHLAPYRFTYGPVIYHESRLSREIRCRSQLRHDLIGSILPGSSAMRPQWRNLVRLKDVQWLGHHRLHRVPVFPAAGYIAMAIEAVIQVYGGAKIKDSSTGFELRNVNFNAPMRLDIRDDGAVDVVTTLEIAEVHSQAKGFPWCDFSISSISKDSDTWTRHCFGRVRLRTKSFLESPISTALDPRTRKKSKVYDWFDRLGLGYGPTFQALSDIRLDPDLNLAAAEVDMRPTREVDAAMAGASSYYMHPASLDAVFQLGLVAAFGGRPETALHAFVPVEIDEMFISQDLLNSPQERALAAALARPRGLRSIYANLQLQCEESGTVPMGIRNLRCMAYSSENQVTAIGPPEGDEGNLSSPYFRLVWRPDVRIINNSQAHRLFAPSAESASSTHLLDKFENLATLYVIDIHERFANLDEVTGASEQTRHFLNWARRFVASYPDQLVVGTMLLDPSERLDNILALQAELRGIPDAEIASVVYERIEDILLGRVTGLEVMLQNDLLYKVYDDGVLIKGAYQQLIKFFDLYGHCNPSAAILELGAGTGGATRKILNTLMGAPGIKRYQQYTFTDISSGFLKSAQDSLSGFPHIEYSVLDISLDPAKQGYGAVYDVVVACECLHAARRISETLENCRKLLKPGGKLVLLENTRAVVGHGLVLGHLSGYWDGIPDGRIDSPFLPLDRWDLELRKAGFSGIQIALDDYPAPYTTAQVIVSTVAEAQIIPQTVSGAPNSPMIHLLHDFEDCDHPIMRDVKAELATKGLSFRVTALSGPSCELPEAGSMISFVSKDDFLANCDSNQFEWFQSMIGKSAHLLWVTFCGIAKGASPNAAVTLGVLRTLASEHPDTRFMSIDIDPDEKLDDYHLARTIVQKALAMRTDDSLTSRENEFVWQDECLWVSRLVPDPQLQDHLELVASPSSALTKMMPWSPSLNIRAAFEVPGILSSLFFEPYNALLRPLPDDWIEVEVAAVGLNWKDLFACTGRFDVDNLSSEYSGTVRRVGARVDHVVVGDMVYGYGRGHFGNYVRGPARGACLMQPGDNSVEMATLPIVCMTVVHTLERATQIKKGESVLVMSATGGLGSVAMQFARSSGASIYATAGTPEKRAFLTNSQGIPASHVFSSRDITDIPRMLDVTNGRGFDVIVSTAGGEVFFEMIGTLAPMGRFIDLGRLDVIKAESLGLEVFRRNAAFISFDLGVAEESDPEFCPSLMTAVDAHLRAGRLSPITPITTFHISQLHQALSTFSKGAHIGKMVITYESRPGTLIRMVPAAPCARFRSDASYLAIGGFGTLGRSILSFMADRGAKTLIVLVRRVTMTREATRLTDRLAALGVRTICIPCDIGDPEQVTRAVGEAQAIGPIRGVVHMAMSLQDKSFLKLTVNEWKMALAAKVHGTKNLHDATRHCNLDFFAMATSIEVIVSLATQSAYTAANNFQDYFARWRRHQGLPASTVAFGLISDKGPLSSDETTLALMARNRVLQVTDDQLVKLFEPCFLNNDITPVGQSPSYWGAVDDPLSIATAVTCFDPVSLVTRGWETADGGGELFLPRWYDDPRVSLVIRAMRDCERSLAASPVEKNTNRGDESRSSVRIEFANIIEKVKTGQKQEQEPAVRLVAESIKRTVAQMLFIVDSEIEIEDSVARYGVDSLIAAELRSWMNVTFDASVDMLDVLDTGTSIYDLATSIVRTAVTASGGQKLT
ncbi:polyketide synthase [Xylariaceae sp. FL0255]|nr:polyketide synthase [Xylariaceae sp. FL0255]